MNKNITFTYLRNFMKAAFYKDNTNIRETFEKWLEEENLSFSQIETTQDEDKLPHYIQNGLWLSECLNLSNKECNYLKFLLLSLNQPLLDFLYSFDLEYDTQIKLHSALLNFTVDEYCKFFTNSTLYKMHIIKEVSTDIVSIDSLYLYYLNKTYKSKDDFINKILSSEKVTSFDFTRFPHIKERNVLLNLLTKTNAHILLIGNYGTGKRAFAKSLINQANFQTCKLFDTSNMLKEETEMFSIIANLSLKNILIKGKNKKCFLIENAERILNTNKIEETDTLINFLNNNNAPAIWIINNPFKIPPYFISKMTYIVDFNSLDLSETCNQLLKDNLFKLTVNLNEHTTISDIKNAITVAKCCDNNENVLQAVITKQAQLIQKLY